MNPERRRAKKDKGPERRTPLVTGEHILKAGAVALTLAAGVTAKDHLSRPGPERGPATYEAIKDDKRLALPMFAMLAHGYLSRPVQLLADPSLRHIRSIDPAAVVPLTTRPADATFVEKYLKERAASDADPRNHVDPNEKYWARIKRESMKDQKVIFSDAIAKYKRDPIQLGQSVAMISRNISWNQYAINYSFGNEDHGSTKAPAAGAEIKPQQVTAEVSAVLKERQRLKESDPLAMSDIVLLSNNERTTTAEGKRFGNAALVSHLQYVAATSSRGEAPVLKAGGRPQRVKIPTPYSFTHITTRAESSLDNVRNAKHAALRAIENGTRKTSFLFDGHGNESGLYLSNGQVENSQYVNGEHISVEEMAASLAKRWFSQKRNDPRATNLNITVMLGSCISQNFIRSLAARLETMGVPQPQIMVSAAEHGQYGFSDMRNTYNSYFWTWVINNETVGQMIENKRAVKDQTPAIFTPRPERPSKLMQLGGAVIPQADSQSA